MILILSIFPGSSAVTCKATNWEKDGTCLTMRCSTSNMPLTPFGTNNCDGLKVYRRGDTCNIICDSQYRHDTSATVATCSYFGRWTSNSKCVRDGNWGEWGQWEKCSKVCGGGTQTRRRSCNDPSPDNGGDNCPGKSSQTQSCNTKCCKYFFQQLSSNEQCLCRLIYHQIINCCIFYLNIMLKLFT